MHFRIEALDSSLFGALAGLDPQTLVTRGIEAVFADTSPGFPCRVSLRDAAVGERLFLLNFEHLPIDTPYRSRHAIFVREHAQTARPSVDEIPTMIRSRLLSLRAFDAGQQMLDADVIEGSDCDERIRSLLALPGAAWVDIHTARRGCYLARARAT